MKLYQTFISIAAAGMLFTGCGSSSTTSTDISGKLVDSALEGVEYHCGQVEANTTREGEFRCSTLPVTFSVGGVTLGTIETLPEDGVVTPYELAHVQRGEANPYVENVVVFLQSLDDDGKINDCITIKQEYAEALQERNIDFARSNEGDVVDLLNEVHSEHIVASKNAMDHLSTQMEALSAHTLAHEVATDAHTDAHEVASDAHEVASDTAQSDAETVVDAITPR